MKILKTYIKINLTILLFTTTLIGQNTDTLKFHSDIFNTERTIFITTPEFYKYQSKEIRLPVIYILDGQHEWFVAPVLNTIRYLQYTHQIPQAIVVTIPLINRNKECEINALYGQDLPLYKFIIEEVDNKIQGYKPSAYKTIIGHSFSASFSLYAYLNNPKYFSSVIANTPMAKFKELILAFKDNENIDLENIFISVGGSLKHEDFYHRKTFNTLKEEFPRFFDSINTFVAENSGHNAVPILATPNMLTSLFSEFNKRFSEVAAVDDEYKILKTPISINEEVKKIKSASKLGSTFYPPELAELNGIASRYWNSSLYEYAITIYEMGIKYYPNYYEFHLQLYELLLPTDKEKAKTHLKKAKRLLNSIETNLSDRREILNEINNEMINNGW